MESIVPKINSISKAGKIKLRVTIMPKNLKVIISVDPEILIGKIDLTK